MLFNAQKIIWFIWHSDPKVALACNNLLELYLKCTCLGLQKKVRMCEVNSKPLQYFETLKSTKLEKRCNFHLQSESMCEKNCTS